LPDDFNPLGGPTTSIFAIRELFFAGMTLQTAGEQGANRMGLLNDRTSGEDNAIMIVRPVSSNPARRTAIANRNRLKRTATLASGGSQTGFARVSRPDAEFMLRLLPRGATNTLTRCDRAGQLQGGSAKPGPQSPFSTAAT
jgi:hypothetical protein